MNSRISMAVDSFLAQSVDFRHTNNLECLSLIDQEMDPMFRGNAVNK